MTPWLHYSPAYGWLNDPNGLVYAGGRHHLYYQHNPHGTAFSDQHWGHATSADLLSWTEHDVALAPGPGGPDGFACFSGCAVTQPGGGVSFLYTGVDEDRVTLPCLAHATADGRLRKDAANPVVARPPYEDVTDFRDHTVWRTGGRWWQLVGGARSGRGGTLFAYTSDDLRSWKFHGVYAESRTWGVPGAVWECPDRIAPGVLVVSVIHDVADPPGRRPADVWWMTADRHGLLDVGDRFYAPQSYLVPDGRRIQFGWVRTHLDAASAGPAVGAISLPRELSVQAGRVLVAPAAELADLRVSGTVYAVRTGATALVLPESRVAGELVLDTPVTRVDLHSHDGLTLTLDLTALPAGRLRLFWDNGIVEAFRGGLAGTWTDLRIAATVRLTVHSDAAGEAEIWRLTRAGRRP